MRTFLTFPTKEEAIQYRKDNGTGGWIFAPDKQGEESIIFPVDMTPSDIFYHPFIRGKKRWGHGELVGCCTEWL
jgi:hypothetical protein